jgi:translation initiation factor 2-alpha kinase 4
LDLVSRPELVGWLQHEIAEQKRVDASTSGAASYPDVQQISRTNKDVPGTADVQLFLPIDVKKQRKLTKQLFLDRGEAHAFGPFLTPDFRAV